MELEKKERERERDIDVVRVLSMGWIMGGQAIRAIKES